VLILCVAHSVVSRLLIVFIDLISFIKLLDSPQALNRKRNRNKYYNDFVAACVA